MVESGHCVIPTISAYQVMAIDRVMIECPEQQEFDVTNTLEEFHRCCSRLP
jgi:hypothetical protein